MNMEKNEDTNMDMDMEKYINIWDFKIKKNCLFVTITQKNRFLTDEAIFNFKNKCLPVKLTFKK
jgi:hypothetical protein